MSEFDGAVELLRVRGAADVVHPGGRLLPHLERTARRLQRWGASDELVRAGLCHAAYGTHGFPLPLLELGERELLREPLGDRAESIVYAYCAYDRDAGGLDTGYVRDRFTGECWMPSASMRRDLAELTAANELDVAQDGALSGRDLSAIGDLLLSLLPLLSEAARFDVLQAPCTRGLARRRCEPRSADSHIAYRELGQGETLLLWHGGAGPQLTWARQHELSQHFTLRIPWRRGFAPSSLAVHQDWEIDARDLLRIMPGSVHVVAHSYGAVSALVAADRWPQRFRSLTLIEPPISSIAEDVPEVRRVAELSRAFIAGEPEARHAFLALASLPPDHPDTLRIERLARGLRDPGEARPSLQAIKSARVPVALVSGVHNRAAEIICDALSEQLAAARWRMPGAGHAPQRMPEFNARLLEWMAA
jgi:pimeloyl-ACP methyl ester carboxylesterase